MKLPTDVKNEPGIYEIYNTVNKKRYIGQSARLRTRILKHFNQLRHDIHQNKHLQSSWNKYGEDKFSYRILEYCKIDDLDERENYYISLYNSNKNEFGYNYRIENTSNRGLKWSEEQREKMYTYINKEDSYHKNHTIPSWVMERAWEASRNRVWTDEDRKKHSEIMKGKKVKDTTKMKIAQTGEGNGCHKLTEKEVIEIIELLKTGNSQMSIAKIYNVSSSNIGAIKSGRSWRHIER